MVTNARRDQNTIAVGLGVSSVDNATPIEFRVDTVTDYLLVSSIGDSLTPTAATKSKRDQNDISTKYGVSDTDGVTILPIRTDTNGRLLVNFI